MPYVYGRTLQNNYRELEEIESSVSVLTDDWNELSAKFNKNIIAGITTNDVNSFINFNFSSLTVEIVGSVFVQTKNGFYEILEDSIPITTSTRWIIYNGATRELISSGNTIPDYGTDDIYIIASLREAILDAYLYGNIKYRINGANPKTMYNPNTNMLEYVVGQRQCCEDHSIPYCDLYAESGINEFNGVSFTEVDNLHPNVAAYTFISQQTTDFIRKYGGFTNLTGKTIGVFGGSFSVNVASQACKDVWVSELGVTYTDYGVGGAGFAKAGNYIDDQVDGAAVHDIYVLWCSTNDATNAAPVGKIGDDTHASQYGGIRQTIEKLVAKNSSAKILLFTSLKAYSADYLNIRNAIR